MTSEPIHETIARLREARGMTQSELARLAGTGQSAISMIECGERNPSWGMAEKLAAALGVSVSFGGRAAPPAEPAPHPADWAEFHEWHRDQEATKVAESLRACPECGFASNCTDPEEGCHRCELDAARAEIARLRAAPPAETGEDMHHVTDVWEALGAAHIELPDAERVIRRLRATPVDPPTEPMDRLKASWANSLPVDPPTGECECKGTGWIPSPLGGDVPCDKHNRDPRVEAVRVLTGECETCGGYGQFPVIEGDGTDPICSDCSGDGEGEVAATVYAPEGLTLETPAYINGVPTGTMTTNLPPGTYRILKEGENNG